jgi:hypothetical protein
MLRSINCQAKVNRVQMALRHQEPDCVPMGESYWGSFLERWRRELGLAQDADPYRYYDLDWIVTVPNMDPHIRSFEILQENQSEVIVRTGFEAVIRKKFADPMPAFLRFETDSLEKMAAFQFDDPWDDRRYYQGGDNQLAGVGDGFVCNLPAWVDTVKSLHPDIAVFGSVCEAHEMLWRMIGTENVMTWIGLYPDDIGRFIERIGRFVLDITRAQIRAGGGLLDGMVIWGDVAYGKDLFFSPNYWRKWFKPVVKAIVDECHAHNLPVIYHGCGNVRRIMGDFIEVGVEAYNPLEVKAGMDVLALRRQYGHQIGFCGNLDVVTWARGDRDEIKRMVLSKMNAAKGGGYIMQSDHSVPSNISGENYDFVIRLIREYGNYPLNLGEFDLPEIQ